MKMILSGDKSEVEKVMKENSLRVSRGLISFEFMESSEEPAKRGRKKAEPIVDGKAKPVEEPKGSKE